MKIFSLMLILVLSMSMVSSASAYGHGDIRAGTVGYLSCSEFWHQTLVFTNNPDLSTDKKEGEPNKNSWYRVTKNDNDAREYIDITKDTEDYWNAADNSKHVFRFWLEGACIVTNSMLIDDIDYNKGLFIAADYSGGTHTAVIYYYDIKGRAHTTNFKYSN
jgi:hypothetical protein